MKALPLLAALFASASAHAGVTSMTLIEPQTLRPLPLRIYQPLPTCSIQRPCPVAFLSNGYGIPYTDYSFVADALTARGYVVVAIDHAAVDDKPFDFQGDLRAQMQVKWKNGVRHFTAVRNQLEKTQAGWEWDKLLLVGHSLGGDQSAYAAKTLKAARVITLDNRRAALPSDVPLLSIRASDTTPDPGVLPVSETACIVKFENAKHNDMFDGGSAELKARIRDRIEKWLDGSCPETR